MSALLKVQNVRKVYRASTGMFGQGRGREPLVAVDDVSFSVAAGETFGIVGESGCGKSTLARCLVALESPTAGSIEFDGVDIVGLKGHQLRRLRHRLQIMLQDAGGALNSRMTCRALLEEPLIVHGVRDRGQRADRVAELFALVGLPERLKGARPHQLSGGQRQRVGLARALAAGPDLVVLDEPVSAVDVSIQAQILNLLDDLQEKLQLTYVFVGHDLTLVEYFCDRTAVIYLGRIVEEADSAALFREPLHPYTVALLSAVPKPDPRAARLQERVILQGDIAQPGTQVRGCPFRPRCPVGRSREVCVEVNPLLDEAGRDHPVACHFPGELKLHRRSLTG